MLDRALRDPTGISLCQREHTSLSAGTSRKQDVAWGHDITVPHSTPPT